MAYVSTIISNGASLDAIYSYVARLEQNDRQPIGFLWDPNSNSPTLKRIDINGNTFNPPSNFFDNWCITGGMRKCVRDRSTGELTYGTNNRGDGLVFDGSMGDVLVEVPTAYSRLTVIEGDCRQYITIPYNTEETRHQIHPCAQQRGGNVRTKIYVGAKEASLLDVNGVLKLGSVSGVQPFTGNAFRSLSFTGGITAFTKGETLTGVTSGATGIVVDFHLTGGSWGGTAAGVVYLRQHDQTVKAYQAAESVTGSVTGSAVASGTASIVSFTISQAENYANNIGSGFGICNPYTYSYLKQLIYTEYGTFDLQSALGKGVVYPITGGVIYSGKLTGDDSIDTRLTPNGTGVGSGTNGYTPICWRNIENFWGNVGEYVIGLNMYASDRSYRIIKRDGTTTPAVTLATDGSTEGGTGVPSSSGFVSGLSSTSLGGLIFLPSAVAGSNTTYLCDYFDVPTGNPAVCHHGGYYSCGTYAGPESLYVGFLSTYSYPYVGCRIEYIPQS